MKLKSNKVYKKKIILPLNVQIIHEKNKLLFIGPLGKNGIDLKKLDPKGIGGIKITEHKKEGTQVEKKNTFPITRSLDLNQINGSVNTKINTIYIYSPDKAFFGSFTSLINNKIDGVTHGFLSFLQIVGVGYRANLDNQNLKLRLGFSHEVFYKVGKGVRIFLLEPTKICLYGIDKNQVAQTAAKIQAIKPPSVYKGKGIRLLNQIITLKPGKRK